MTDQRNPNQEQQGASAEAAAAKQAGTQPARGDVVEQRGGAQADQISGEADEGARNQTTRNRNPQGA